MTPPDISVDVLVKETAWQKQLDAPEVFCEHIINIICSECEVSKRGDISIVLMSDDDIQELNKAYRGKDRPTNVLSFSGAGPAPILGDIAIALETTIREAGEMNKSFQDHVTHLLVHGFLHLQGYDHENDDEAAIMEGLEIKFLTKMNIDNPYIIKEPVAQ